MKWEQGLLVLSADPVTFGHLELIKQALLQCKKLLVLVMINHEKADRYLFSLVERGEMTMRAIHERFGVREDLQVIYGHYRATQIARAFGCDVLIRGLRHERERAYEEEVIAELRAEDPTLSGLIIPAREPFAHISSTEVRRRARHDPESLSSYVPPFVADALRNRFPSQQRGVSC